MSFCGLSCTTTCDHQRHCRAPNYPGFALQPLAYWNSVFSFWLCPQFCFDSYNANVLPSKSNQEIFFSSPGNWSHLTEIGRHRWPQAGLNDPEFSLIRILSVGARRQIKLFFYSLSVYNASELQSKTTCEIISLFIFSLQWQRQNKETASK